MSTRDTIIQTAERLEALPPLAAELIGLLQSHDADVNRVAEVIAHDPANAANVLKLANSAAMAPRSPITSVKQAVMRIGLKRTTELVLHGVVAKHAGKPVLGYDLAPGALWEFSAAAAIATEKLAQATGDDASPEAFTAGLFQDLGKLVLGHFVRVDSAPIHKVAFSQNRSFEEAERVVLGIDHAEVGAILLDSWGIGGTVRDAVRWHHEPESAPEQARPIARLVHAAGQIVNLAGIGGGADGLHYKPSASALNELQVRPKVVEQVLLETTSQLESLRELTRELSESSAP
ncbi:MAG: HDOD domain-containing protein [Planctomycetota bacterium]